MKRKKNLKPTDSELEILQVLWKLGSAPVKQVNDSLNKKKETGYTTTLKLMQIMFEKGLLTREKSGRSHIYNAAYREEETQQAVLDRILESAFGGSAGKLIMQALGNKNLSKDERESIKELIDKMERKEK